jgi:hypothetical protein
VTFLAKAAHQIGRGLAIVFHKQNFAAHRFPLSLGGSAIATALMNGRCPSGVQKEQTPDGRPL